MSRKSAPAPGEPLFHAFDPRVPDAAACLDGLYEAFAYHVVSYGWCRQCFDLDAEQRMRAARKVREAPLAVFSPIYFENPNCSGGASTFLHWLPRGLELACFDRQLDPDLTEQMMRLGLWQWPAEEQAALRTLFIRVALNWFEAGDVSPLRLTETPRTPRARLNISLRIVQTLLCLRIDAAGVFGWMMALDRPDAWDCLLDMLQDTSLLLDPSYYVLDHPADEAALAVGLAAVERIARHVLHASLSPDRVAEVWMALQATDPVRAEQIADAELTIAAVAFALTPAQLAADEALVRAALDTRR